MSLCLGSLCALLASAPVIAAAPGKDPDALNRSLEMLRIETKLQALQTYVERADFYVPPEWPRRLQAEYTKLAEETGGDAKARIKEIDSWLAESREAQKNEVYETYKIAENAIGKLAKAEKWLTEYRQAKVEWDEVSRQKKKTALQVARLLEGMTLRMRQVAKNRIPGEGAEAEAFAMRIELEARAVYKGSITDTDNRVKAIASREEQRRKLEARLVFLKEFQEHLKTAGEVREALEDPGGTLKKKALEYAEETARTAVLDYLKAHYLDIDDDAVKAEWARAKGTFTAATNLYGKLDELDKDMSLKNNPLAMSKAKDMAMLSALYNYTLGQVKNLPVIKSMGPLCDFLEFYGSALELVPVVAQKMQRLVEKVDQKHKGARAFDAFNIVGRAPADLRQVDALNAFEFQVATDTTVDETSPNARYYMLVPKEVMPRGFASLDREQFNRMCEAIAAERFLNAPKEASRGVYEVFIENMFETRNTNVVSANVSDAYLNDLKSKTHKTPFKHADLINLAQGRSVTINGFEWSAKRFADMADSELDLRGLELMIRVSTGRYNHDVRNQWAGYVALLKKHEVALSPKQIQNLFSYWQSGGANIEHLVKYLGAVGDERAARARGTAAAGVPLITSATPGAAVEPGTSVNIVADVIVSDLAPGRQVDARTEWVMPKGVPIPPPQSIKLPNGITSVSCKLEVPKRMDGKTIEARLIVTIPGEQGENAIAEATASIAASTAPAPPPPASPPQPETPNTPAPATTPTGVNAVATSAAPPPHEYIGAGVFDIEAPETGPVRITLRKLGNGGNGLEVVSESLAGLTDKPGPGVELVLYRSEAPTGPFRRLNRGVWMDHRDPPPTTGEPREHGWLDKDKYLLVTSCIDNYEGETKPPRGPFYYQVGLFATTRDGERQGKESKSNITKLGKGVIRFVDSSQVKDSVATDSTINNEWRRIDVALSLDDQWYDAWGAHFTATSDGWTGHFFSDRQENDRQYGFYASGLTAIGSRAGVRIPYRSSGGSVQITATDGTLSATASLTIPADPKRAADEQRNGEAVEKPLQLTMANLKEQLAGMKKGMAESEERLRSAKPPTTFSEAHSSGRPTGIAIGKADIKLLEEHRLAGEPKWRATAAAEARWDWAGALAASSGHEALIQTLHKINRERISAEIADRQWVLGHPGDFSNLREHYTKEVARLKQRLEEERRSELTNLAALNDARAKFALLAGDGGTYRALRAAQFQYQDELKWSASTVAGIMMSAADELAILTGDRGGAAGLYTLGLQKSVEATQPEFRAQRQADLQRIMLPAYFPPGPVPQTGDMKGLTENKPATAPATQASP